MEKVEFRLTPEGNVYYKETGQEEKRITRFSVEIIEPMEELIAHNHPECYARLQTLYGADTNNPIALSAAKARVVERFIRCNFGAHDLLTHDIEHGVTHFEEVFCPLRGGFCKEEGIICKPKSIFDLQPAEREIVNLYINGCTLSEISERLGKTQNTVNVQLHNIKNRLQLKNCREILRVFRHRDV